MSNNTYQVIKTELDGNTALYSSMTDQQVVDELNVKNKDPVNASMSGGAFWNNTDWSQYSALVQQDKSDWIAFCGIESVDPFGTAVQFVISIFGGVGNATTDNLIAARNLLKVSRADILRLQKVRLDHVVQARALP